MKTKYENGEIAKEQYETAKVMIDLAMSGITGMLAFGKTGQEKKTILYNYQERNSRFFGHQSTVGRS